MRIKIFDNMAQCTDEEVQRMLPLVSAQRREKALRYKHTFGRFCCLRSWLMLQELIGDMPDWQFNEHGKPFIEGGPFFSLSHCKTGIAVAVDDEPIGIDIEHIRRADKELIRRTMNADEALLIANANANADIAFTRLWTQKEAIVKWQGTGIESFEQLQTILLDYQKMGVSENRHLQTIENENYIYSIANGKLHCFSA